MFDSKSGPLVITQNEEASAVLMGVKDYENLQSSLALLKILALGRKSTEEGRSASAREVFARLASLGRLRKGRENVI